MTGGPPTLKDVDKQWTMLFKFFDLDNDGFVTRMEFISLKLAERVASGEATDEAKAKESIVSLSSKWGEFEPRIQDGRLSDCAFKTFFRMVHSIPRSASNMEILMALEQYNIFFATSYAPQYIRTAVKSA